MTEDQLRKFLADSADEIKQTVKARTIERLLEQHKWSITDQIAKAVNEFVSAEVIPAVQAELAANKGAIIEAAIKSLSAISDDLAQGLAADASKNVKSSYRRQAIIKAMFGLH